MLPLIVPEKQYVLSLDSLDLNFLCQYIQRNPHETKPLWSKPYKNGESTYCHVELVSENLQSEDYCLDLYETYLCHICNIEVPQTCYRKHIKSQKHQVYEKLTEKVLENVTKQIKVSVDNISNNGDENLYYCESCSKLVMVQDEHKHNLSNYHLKSIQNEKLTNDFLEMYIESTKANETITEYNSAYDMNGFSEDESASESENFISTVSITPINYSTHGSGDDSEPGGVLFSDSESPSESENFISAASTIPVNYTEHETKEIHQPHESDDEDFMSISSTPNESFEGYKEDMVNFELYLKEMSAKYELNFKIPTVEKNSVIIVTPKGYKEHFSFDTFHSYKRIDSFIFCQVCQMWVELKLKQHSATKQHVDNILQSVNDNFEREVVNNPGLLRNGPKSHCLLCNDIVLAGTNHEVRNPNHKKYSHTNAEKTFCEVCRVNIDTHNFINHTKGEKHKKKIKTKTNNMLNAITSNKSNAVDVDAIIKKYIQTNSVANTRNNEAPVKMKKTFCHVCKVHIDSHNFLAHTHTNASKHKKMIETNNQITQMTPKENITPVTVQIASLDFCNTCQVHVPKGGMAIHVLGKSHRNKVIINAVNSGTIPRTSNSAPNNLNRKERRKLKQKLQAKKV